MSNIFEGECALLDVIVQMNAALNPDGDTDPQDTGEVLAPSQGEIMTPEDDMRILRLFSYDVELFLLQADFTDGIRYVGEWMHGHIHGRGTLYRQDSKIISGFFREGIFIPDENI